MSKTKRFSFKGGSVFTGIKNNPLHIYDSKTGEKFKTMWIPTTIAFIDIANNLDAELDRLRDALEFYAYGDWNEHYPGGIWVDVELDFGGLAREALEAEV